MELESLVKKVIQSAYNVRLQLPAGFLESVYQKAVQNLSLIHEAQLVNYLTATKLTADY